MILPPDRPLAIIAGGGSVPLHVARAAEQAGRKTLVVGIDGEADADFGGFSYERFSWGQIGKLERLLSGHGARDVVIVGGVRVRPDFRLLTQLDMGTVKALPEIYAILRKGDNSVLTGVIRFIEARGYSVVGAHEVATDLVAPEGTLVGKPSAEQLADARLAIEAADRAARCRPSRCFSRRAHRGPGRRRGNRRDARARRLVARNPSRPLRDTGRSAREMFQATAGPSGRHADHRTGHGHACESGRLGRCRD
jgi:hypothetical protein